MGISVEVIAQAIIQLGVAGIFVWLFIQKDNDNKELRDKVIDSFNKNTEVQANIKNAVENNTRAITEVSQLTSKIYEELIRKD